MTSTTKIALEKLLKGHYGTSIRIDAIVVGDDLYPTYLVVVGDRLARIQDRFGRLEVNRECPLHELKDLQYKESAFGKEMHATLEGDIIRMQDVSRGDFERLQTLVGQSTPPLAATDNAPTGIQPGAEYQSGLALHLEDKKSREDSGPGLQLDAKRGQDDRGSGLQLDAKRGQDDRGSGLQLDAKRGQGDRGSGLQREAKRDRDDRGAGLQREAKGGQDDRGSGLELDAKRGQDDRRAGLQPDSKGSQRNDGGFGMSGASPRSNRRPHPVTPVRRTPGARRPRPGQAKRAYRVVRPGSILSRTFSAWFKNLVPFTILTIIIYSPVLVYAVANYGQRLDGEALTVYQLVVLFGGKILGLVVTGAITYGVFEQLRGRSAPIGRCLAMGLSRLLPILGTGIIVGILMMFGYLACIVPGVILMCMFWLAVPVTVVEQEGVIASISRSKELTHGYKGTIFAIIFLLGLIEFVVGMVLQQVIGGGSNYDMQPDSLSMYLLASVIISLPFVTLAAIAAAVTYHDIRTASEGVDIDDLLEVFS